jgi:L-fuconolactonase
MPDFPIIDTHVHFWNSDSVAIDWIADIPQLANTFEPGDLSDHAGEVDIEGLIFVEAAVREGNHIAEAAWVGDLARDDPRIKGIVAHAPMHLGAQVKTDLEQLAAIPEVKGIRRLLQQEEDPEFCLQADFLEAVELLPDYDFHFEICILHPQLEAATEMVRLCPDVPFILDHIGKPGIKDEMFEPWGEQISELATLHNVVCKLSGVATEADHDNWTEDQLAPYISHVLNEFGPERVLFGGDWPVATLALAYPRWIEVVDNAMADWSHGDRYRVYSENARHFYRL